MPKRSGGVNDGRAHFRQFFKWYNNGHTALGSAGVRVTNPLKLEEEKTSAQIGTVIYAANYLSRVDTFRRLVNTPSGAAHPTKDFLYAVEDEEHL